jgi:hypothetical protein
VIRCGASGLVSGSAAAVLAATFGVRDGLSGATGSDRYGSGHRRRDGDLLRARVARARRGGPDHCVRQRRHRRDDPQRAQPVGDRPAERHPRRCRCRQAAGDGLPRSGRVRARPRWSGRGQTSGTGHGAARCGRGPLHHRHGHVVTRSVRSHWSRSAPSPTSPWRCSSSRGSRSRSPRSC